MRIALAGPPFSGKTEVGRRLAERLGLALVDLDAQIERDAGMPIPRIFADRGERTFRRLESAALRMALRQSDVVIAMGGGALLDAADRDRVLKLCRVFTLYASPGELLARSREGGRPLAPDGESLRRLLRRRRAHYLSLPNRVDTTGRDPSEVCATIARALGPA